MSIKSFAIIATSAAAIATASLAAADTSYFEYQRELPSRSILELGSVTSQGAGVVEVYDFRGSTQGALLGSQTVRAGANPDVRISTGAEPRFDVVANLVVNGQTVASHEYQINRSGR